jgi:hypothetical protein
MRGGEPTEEYNFAKGGLADSRIVEEWTRPRPAAMGSIPVRGCERAERIASTLEQPVRVARIRFADDG